MTIRYTPKRLFSASLLVATLSGLAFPALALDADDFATKIAAVFTQSGAKLSFASVEPDGDTIVLKSTRLESPGQPPLAIGDVTFDGVEEDDDGSYYVEQARFQDVDMVEGPTHVTVADMEMSGLTIPADPTYETLSDVLFYESMSTGEIRVEKDGKQVFSMSGASMAIDRADDDSTVGMQMTGSGMAIDLSQVDDPKATEALTELGYTTLTGEINFDALWEVEPGTIAMREYSLTLDDVGRLAMTLEISGYTLELIKAMQQAQAAAAANPDPQAAQQAMGMSMLGLAQQLSFNSASIRFEDDSVTKKALAFAGKKQGISGEDMTMAVKGMLPLMLGQLGIPALQQQISAAVNVYLDNPGSITISAEPASPVGVPMIMGAGMGNPRSLVDLLNVKVTAND